MLEIIMQLDKHPIGKLYKLIFLLVLLVIPIYFYFVDFWMLVRIVIILYLISQFMFYQTFIGKIYLEANSFFKVLDKGTLETLMPLIPVIAYYEGWWFENEMYLRLILHIREYLLNYVTISSIRNYGFQPFKFDIYYFFEYILLFSQISVFLIYSMFILNSLKYVVREKIYANQNRFGEHIKEGNKEADETVKYNYTLIIWISSIGIPYYFILWLLT